MKYLGTQTLTWFEYPSRIQRGNEEAIKKQEKKGKNWFSDLYCCKETLTFAYWTKIYITNLYFHSLMLEMYKSIDLDESFFFLYILKCSILLQSPLFLFCFVVFQVFVFEYACDFKRWLAAQLSPWRLTICNLQHVFKVG